MDKLIEWNKIEQQIDEVQDLKTIVKMQEQVEAIKILVKQTDGSLKTQNKCSRYRIFLEQKAGELYKQIPDESTRSFTQVTTPTNKQRFIEEAGKTRKTISKWAKEADIPKEKILEYENLCNKEGEELTSAGLLHSISPAHVSYSTGENEWDTPLEFIQAARQAMGSIDVDPASNEQANKRIQADKYYTIKDSGLDKAWRGNIWMNPPYSQPLITQFCNLLVEKYKNKEIKQACVLVNNATETNFFQNMLSTCIAICFIRGRVKFIDKEGYSSGAPLQGQSILYLGKNLKGFIKEFEKFGIIMVKHHD